MRPAPRPEGPSGQAPSAAALPFGAEFPWLAPLAGFTDLPFRMLCREQGAAAACTEMVSAKGLVYGARS
ncbi:MAG: tRNA-dihydrouridine synthase, partial [Deltaproteobacteria bacterium]|nr:tRNA-dihydrouridine synthase [Deltaproteobacteria bacterium]